jgi:hypothetical protein
MIVNPPWLNGLWIIQQLYRQFIEQYKWNYSLEEDDNGKDDKDEDNNNEDSKDDNNSNVDNDNNASSPTTSNKKRKYSPVMGMSVPKLEWTP